MVQPEPLGEVQPNVVWPSKSRIQPSAISFGVRVARLPGSAARADSGRRTITEANRMRLMACSSGVWGRLPACLWLGRLEACPTVPSCQDAAPTQVPQNGNGGKTLRSSRRCLCPCPSPPTPLPLGERGGRKLSRQVEVLFLNDVAELLHRPGVQLTHALLGDPELLADLLQRHALGVIVQARSHANDRPLARLQILQETVDTVRGPLGRRQRLVLVTAVVRPRVVSTGV